VRHEFLEDNLQNGAVLVPRHGDERVMSVQVLQLMRLGLIGASRDTPSFGGADRTIRLAIRVVFLTRHSTLRHGQPGERIVVGRESESTRKIWRENARYVMNFRGFC
jgi:hypothetical protein